MTTKHSADGESPSTSTAFLPKLRRASIVSLSSTSQMIGKEVLAETLDQIHNTASQSDTLTTFNEYTSPPSSSAGTEGKGITSELQGGLSGLYSRLRASVGNVRDSISTVSDDNIEDDASAKSQRLIPSPTPTRQPLDAVKSFTSSVHSGGDNHGVVADRHSSQEKPTIEGDPQERVWKQRPSNLSAGAIGLVSRGSSASNIALRSPIGVPVTPAAATVAEISVNAVKNRDNVDRTDEGGQIAIRTPYKPSVGHRGEAHVSEKIPQHRAGGLESRPGSVLEANAPPSITQIPGVSDSATRARSEALQKQGGARANAQNGQTNPIETLSEASHHHMLSDSDKHVPTKIQQRSSQPAFQDFGERSLTSADTVELASPEDLEMPLLRHQSSKTGYKDQIHQHVERPSKRSLGPQIGIQSRAPEVSLTRTSSDTTAVTLIHVSHHKSSRPERGHEDDREHGKRVQQSQPKSTTAVVPQVRNKVLSREYWMRDENAKDCFYCGDPFSTFRRKHHCRTCGQIFDAKCTVLLSGASFGQSGSLRVCKQCEGILRDFDDSSDFSDDSSVPTMSLRPRHGSTGASDSLGSPIPRSSPTAHESVRRGPMQPDLSLPTMAIPATRKAGGDPNRRPTILDIGQERTLTRPSSSRSLKSSLASRPHALGHRRHGSRHLTQSRFKSLNEESAPFHQTASSEKGTQRQLPAFHDDNIIDPDLAPYLSDEGSSGDEQMSIMAALGGTGMSRSLEHDKTGLSGLLSSSKKSRSRLGEKSTSAVNLASRDTDNISLTSSRGANLQRSSRRRNLSVASNLHLRPSPRGHRPIATMPVGVPHFHLTSDVTDFTQNLASPTPSGGPRMMRSSSMRGTAAPAVELNNASLQHVRKLLRQLLQDEDLQSVSSWERALVPILLQATDDVNPDVQRGDDIDIRHYIKLKRIPGGRPGDTSYVSGLVFTKNLALKSMPRSIADPNILILTFALEYARHQQHFMSLEPVIRQEREYLENLISRIAALNPQLLLVQRNVSGLALELLEKAGIATAYNVKASVLEAVSRCSQTRIISSVDKLAIKPAHAGTCSNFYLKTYVHRGRKKTYTFLSGCAKELGCTIVLRGAENDVLAKVKRITEFMVYVVYNLKLETCLMRDEFALIPSSIEIGTLAAGKNTARKISEMSKAETAPSIVTEKEPKNPSNWETKEDVNVSADVSNSDVLNGEKHTFPESERSEESTIDDANMPDDVPMPTFYGDMVEKHKTKILSASPFVKFTQPYLLQRAREQERRLAYLKRLRDQDITQRQTEGDQEEPQEFKLIEPAMVHATLQDASKKVREVLHAVHDAEYDKAMHNYQTQSKQWEAYIAGNINLFDPYTHQNIAVLYSVVCTLTTVPCSGPDLLALSFYNEHETNTDFEADCTLGQYVEELCLHANNVCTVNGCEKKMLDHHRQYVHGEAQLSVFVERHPCRMRGLENVILMWSCCRICGKETQVLPMSESSWKYSFGKYLELSFWSSDLHARAGVCPHDLHRDHLRYFGFQNLAVRVHYDPITLLEIIVPRARVTWKVENDLRFKNDLFIKIQDRLNRFMISVKNRLKSIKVDSVIPEKVETCRQEVNRLTKQANDEHQSLNQKLQEKYMNSKYFEIIPLNRALRFTQEKVAEWDNTFAEFDRNFFPSEKDIRRLATLQLRKIFLEREDSNAPLTTGEVANIAQHEGALSEKMLLEETPVLTPQTRDMSPEKARDMLASVVEKDASSDQPPAEPLNHHQNAPELAVLPAERENIQTSVEDLEKLKHEDVRHLDLAVSSKLAESLDDGKASSDVKPSQTEDSELQSPNSKSTSGSSVLHLSTESTQRKSGEEPISKDFAFPEPIKISGIPRPIEGRPRRAGSNLSPPLYRAQSHPSHVREESGSSSSQHSLVLPQSPNSNTQYQRKPEPTTASTTATAIPKPTEKKLFEHSSHVRDGSGSSSSHYSSMIPQSPLSNTQNKRKPEPVIISTPAAAVPKPTEKRLSDRGLIGAVKPGAIASHSLIPRSIATRRADSKVSSLAKHFEQLSREFEKERLRERRQRAAKNRRSRVYPMAASKPIVEIYRNVHEAVEEREPSDEDMMSSDPPSLVHEESSTTAEHMAHNLDSQTQGEGFHAEDTTAETTETEENHPLDSHIGSDNEGEGLRTGDDPALLEDLHIPGTAEEHHALTPTEAQLDLKLDLPKHEKTSLMKMLTNFWAERSASGWQALDYPLNASDHIFADSDIIIREDEPSSLIAFALGSEDYQAKLRLISEGDERTSDARSSNPSRDSSADNDEQIEVERSLIRSTGTHLKFQFQEGSAKMLCKVFFAEQFDAVRRKCGVSERIVESLSRCLKWDSKGGKTKSVFLKTLDDRFVLKSLAAIETQAFLRFAPAYFQIMSESLFHELPSAIAKMLGFYQIIIKNPVTGVEFNWFVLVMENLFYDRSPTRIFDLKGSMRNRRIQSTGEQNEVLLDENMVEFIYESPLFSREHSKKLLRASVWNDTLFLSKQNVMDYSLMVAIDDVRKELVVGIIDCIRTYTWDKKLEFWIKDRGKNKPTVTSPRDYKNRFREAMGRYVLQAPNCWHHFSSHNDTRPLPPPPPAYTEDRNELSEKHDPEIGPVQV